MKPSIEDITTLHSVQEFFFFQAEDGIRDYKVTGVQTCALPIFFTFAVQRFSSCTSKLSTPGIVAAIEAGSFNTCHTVARGASKMRSPSTIMRRPQIGRASCRERV